MDKLTNIYLSENPREGAAQFRNFDAYVNKLTIEDSRKIFINGIKKPFMKSFLFVILIIIGINYKYKIVLRKTL